MVLVDQSDTEGGELLVELGELVAIQLEGFLAIGMLVSDHGGDNAPGLLRLMGVGADHTQMR